jgi:sarcosine oxidase
MDGLPHLHAGEDGLYMALGYNGRGIAMATALGFALGRHIGAGAPLDFPVRRSVRWPRRAFSKIICGHGTKVNYRRLL